GGTERFLPRVGISPARGLFVRFWGRASPTVRLPLPWRFRYFRFAMKSPPPWMRRTITLLGLSLVPGVALAAVTVKGQTAGTAKLMNPVWNEAKDPKNNRYTFREPSATVRPDVRNLTGFLPKELCIAALSEKGAPLKVPLRMIVAGGRTTPVTLVVAE